MAGRASYFAPVLGWRAHGRLRLADLGPMHPHLVAGVGGATVASSSPFMRKETDPVFYWGTGVSLPVAGSWSVRVDARHGVMAARDGVTSTLELQVGIASTFALPRRPRTSRPAPAEDPQPIQRAIDGTDERRRWAARPPRRLPQRARDRQRPRRRRRLSRARRRRRRADRGGRPVPERGRGLRSVPGRRWLPRPRQRRRRHRGRARHLPARGRDPQRLRRRRWLPRRGAPRRGRPARRRRAAALRIERARG